jgi:hypothetical protein
MVCDSTAINQAQSPPITIGDAPLPHRHGERDDEPPYDDSPRLVSYHGAVAIYGPDPVSQIISLRRHYEGDDGPCWSVADLEEIVVLITIETTMGRARP